MRVEYPGAIYHVMDRGDRREDIFVNDVHRQDLLKTLAEACQKAGWQAQEKLRPLRRGWCLGSEQFRQELLERMDGKLGENHSGELPRETAEQKANRIVSEALSRRGWTESDLAARRRSDPDKLALAVRRRNQTTLPVKCCWPARPAISAPAPRRPPPTRCAVAKRLRNARTSSPVADSTGRSPRKSTNTRPV